MYVENIMTHDVVTVAADAEFGQLTEIMRLKKVRHVPVVDSEQRILGIVSHRDVQRAQPSMITTLDIGEIKYLLSKVKAGDIMHKNVVTCSPKTLIEEAARMMRPNKIGCLPVVDGGRLVGIITSVDLLDFFLDITGCWVENTTRVTVRLADQAGQLAALLANVNAQGGYIVAVVSPRTPQAEGRRSAVIRFEATDPQTVIDGLKQAGYDLTVDETTGG
ncbi:MAG TPA: CBS and ACT domain-containing protein [Azoarcus taiwanensis]|uniref:CBS domain-containing protein n=1 Tax=Azoarcus taiwanensis TaxID=666964 RepID=A0A972FBP5_9RHOO|nr:CBS and ACT domain-containing protein [Azoarcus taiwanensis]NMG02328.1 CBS domain-containing protein [Azoarcus taiwanensis]HRQ55848.1 CBS and ACT domain-containing protein [Azoarcus taiwanensis]